MDNLEQLLKEQKRLLAEREAIRVKSQKLTQRAVNLKKEQAAAAKKEEQYSLKLMIRLMKKLNINFNDEKEQNLLLGIMKWLKEDINNPNSQNKEFFSYRIKDGEAWKKMMLKEIYGPKDKEENTNGCTGQGNIKKPENSGSTN